MYASATHAVFCGPAYERLVASGVVEVVVTDTVTLSEKPPKELNLTVLSISHLLGEAILRIHENRSVSKMFRD